MGIFGVSSGGLSGTFCEPDDDSGDFHLGETINVVNQLAADDLREETFCLF